MKCAKCIARMFWALTAKARTAPIFSSRNKALIALLIFNCVQIVEIKILDNLDSIFDNM
nr:MAG TPA: hypothetical protein [Caudoviricetes sp.]